MQAFVNLLYTLRNLAFVNTLAKKGVTSTAVSMHFFSKSGKDRESFKAFLMLNRLLTNFWTASQQLWDKKTAYRSCNISKYRTLNSFLAEWYCSLISSWTARSTQNDWMILWTWYSFDMKLNWSMDWSTSPWSNIPSLYWERWLNRNWASAALNVLGKTAKDTRAVCWSGCKRLKQISRQWKSWWSWDNVGRLDLNDFRVGTKLVWNSLSRALASIPFAKTAAVVRRTNGTPPQ